MTGLAIDPLTGVASADHFLGVLANVCHAADPLRAPVSLALVNVDHFTAFNARYDSATGDCELVRIARLIAGTGRHDDLVARLCEDRFAWLMPNTEALVAAELVEALRAAVQLNVPPEFELTVSIGFVTGWDNLSADQLIEAARTALQEAKGNGRNLVAMYRPTIGPTADLTAR
ncbi:MAG: GGDEF domain-containing protein [Proteobacteria bacterium]|nr:GGDEF domain-containing protein [Pseudomonadota bacterium]